MKLYSVCRRKKGSYPKASSDCSTVFENKLNRDFKADGINQKWCIDFTYLPLANGKMMYNCSVIDLYDRSIVSSITDKLITADLAVRTVKKALDAHPEAKNAVMLHSDRGSQFTSKQFVDFCKAQGITQSMSRPGCPTDNAVIERYFNTFKHEFANLHEFKSAQELCERVARFVVWYNNVRPHSYNDYLTPNQKCSGNYA